MISTELVSAGRATLPASSSSVAERLAAAFLAGYSGNTRAAYASDLTDWWAWCTEHDLDPLEASRAHVDLYARKLEEIDGRAPNTVARRLSTLAGFYRRATEEDVIGRSPLAHVRRPRVSEDSVSTGLDRDELRSLLVVARADSPRSFALVTLLSMNGLRVSEACNATVEDLSTERGHRVLQILRKGGRRARVALPPITVEAIELVLAGRSEGPILATATGRALDRIEAGRTVKRLAHRAGISRSIHAHDLRHAFVTLSLDAGAQLRDVQDAAGHSDPRTTRRYDRARFALDRSPSYTLASFISE